MEAVMTYITNAMIIVGLMGMTVLGLAVKFWFVVIPVGFLIWVGFLIPLRKWRAARRQVAETLHLTDEADETAEKASEDDKDLARH
jgi:hypothetical protein